MARRLQRGPRLLRHIWERQLFRQRRRARNRRARPTDAAAADQHHRDQTAAWRLAERCTTHTS